MEILAAVGWLLACIAAGLVVWGQQRLEGLRVGGERALGQARERAEAAIVKVVRDRDETIARVRRSADEQHRFAHEPLVKDLLVVVDDFERALEHLEPDEAGAQGVKAIHGKLLATLQRHGVSRVETMGQAFDPAVHEAVGIEPSPEAENTVVSEWSGAYRLHDRVLRAAKVVLAAPPIYEELLDPSSAPEVEARDAAEE